MLKPRGEHVGVTLSSVDQDDDREIADGDGDGARDGARDGGSGGGAAAGDGSSLFESLLGMTDGKDLDAVDDYHKTLSVNGEPFSKAAACRYTFGPGDAASNDRLLRVRGVGRYKSEGSSALACDTEDMAACVLPGDVGLVTASVLGGGRAVCLVVAERLDLGGASGVESVTLVQLAASTTYVRVKLAVVEARDGCLVYEGRVTSDSAQKVAGGDFTPIKPFDSDEKGLSYKLDELAAFVAQPERRATACKFLAPTQHATLAIAGSKETPTCVATCAVCDLEFKDPAKLRGHVVYHWYNGELGAGVASEVSFCGFCGAPMMGDSCATSVTNLDKASSTTKLLSSCPAFPGPSMSYTSANKPTPLSTPSTNLPVMCNERGCAAQRTTYWRFNVASHYAGAHSDLAVTERICSVVRHVQAMSKATDPLGERRAAENVLETIGEEHAVARDNLRRLMDERESVLSLDATESKKARKPAASKSKRQLQVPAKPSPTTDPPVAAPVREEAPDPGPPAAKEPEPRSMDAETPADAPVPPAEDARAPAPPNVERPAPAADASAQPPKKKKKKAPTTKRPAAEPSRASKRTTKAPVIYEGDD